MRCVINGMSFECSNNARISVNNGTIKIDGNTIEVGEIKSSFLSIKIEGGVASIECDSSVECGDVQGDVKAGNYVKCGNVSRSVSAGNYVDCSTVGGDVSSGGHIYMKRE